MMKKILLLIVVCMLGACLGGYSPKSSFYKLKIFDGSQASVSEKKFSVGVNMVELPDYLNRPQIVSFDEDNLQMQIDETNRWGEPLDTMIRRVVVGDLSSFLPNAVVKAKASLIEKFDYLVNLQIVRFDMIEDKEAVLEAWWYVVDRNGKTLVREKFSDSEVMGDDYTQFVKFQSEMIEKMCEKIALRLASF